MSERSVRIGFPIPLKENERRRAMSPSHLSAIEKPSCMYFEPGYFSLYGVDDSYVLNAGANLLGRSELLGLDVVCNPKAAEPEEFDLFRGGNTLFGWIHAVQGRAITDFLVQNKMTAIAWEDMYEDGRHTFWRNNLIAGEAAMLHACLLWGRSPRGVSAAVLGRGCTGQGAIAALSMLGANVQVFRDSDISVFQRCLGDFDVVANCVLWDVFRSDRILYRRDLARMRPGSMIVDVSCNHSMEIESCHPTSFSDPVYSEGGILHYCVDHTPALLYKDATSAIGDALVRHLNVLARGDTASSAALCRATIIQNGEILDKRIAQFQGR